MRPHPAMFPHITNVGLFRNSQFAICELRIIMYFYRIMVMNIIHLSQRTDRQVHLMEEIKQQGIEEYKLWEGRVDLTTPKAGILKAHKQIVRWARERNMEKILIAEDDVKFTFKNAFEHFLNNEPADYDLYLGGIFYGEVKSDFTVSDFAGATMYIIKRAFFDIFLSLSETINSDFDRELAHKGKYVVCNPFVVTQYNGYSDNAKRHRDYNKYRIE